MRDRAEVTMTAQTDEGFLVASVRREQIGGNRAPYFSVGADLYTSRRAFELGSDEAIVACGCLHEQILRAFPQLAHAVAMHGAWTDNGEPVHAKSNALYHMREGNDRYAADTLRVGLATVRRAYFAWSTRAADSDAPSFSNWIDETLRPRWRWEAERLNAWIDAHQGGPVAGASELVERESDDDFYLDLGDPDDADSLRVHARLSGEEPTENGMSVHYAYTVSVWDGEHTYETTYGGSIADYQDGRVCAREAAFGVLRELADFAQYDSAEDNAEAMGIDPEVVDNWPQWEAAHAAAIALSDHLEAHGELVGR